MTDGAPLALQATAVRASRGGRAVLDGVDLAVRRGEFLTLFGPNGCGKSTFLDLLAGLGRPDGGTITWPGGAPRAVGYVFQSYAETLLPWATVRANVALPLRARGVPRAERRARADAELRRYRLEAHAQRYPYELSGGLRQLVAIARATVYRPDLLLLDEPFSALDHATARTLWRQVREAWAEHAVTTVCVTHDLDEALVLGDRVCVLAPRPTRVVDCFAVPFGAGRDPALLAGAEARALRAAVLDAMERAA